MTASKELWTCPKCGRVFVNTNQYHSCGNYTVDQFLKDKSDYSVELYNRFVETLEAIGPFIYAPVKTRIGFQVRTTFAAINRIGPDYIEGHLCLARHCKGSPFYKIECFSPRLHVHHFKIRKAGDFDREFQAILREAYIGGRGSIGRK